VNLMNNTVIDGHGVSSVADTGRSGLSSGPPRA
jgi:hypothetical protein